jgi:hypothetical protein
MNTIKSYLYRDLSRAYHGLPSRRLSIISIGPSRDSNIIYALVEVLPSATSTDPAVRDIAISYWEQAHNHDSQLVSNGTVCYFLDTSANITLYAVNVYKCVGDMSGKWYHTQKCGIATNPSHVSSILSHRTACYDIVMDSLCVRVNNGVK